VTGADVVVFFAFALALALAFRQDSMERWDALSAELERLRRELATYRARERGDS
jgi:hypothetical protein